MSQSRLPVIEANRLRSILRPVLSPRSRRRSSGVGCCFHGRAFHESQAKKALIQARRNDFPKNLERQDRGRVYPLIQRLAQIVDLVQSDQHT
jgi:hypothetical protein